MKRNLFQAVGRHFMVLVLTQVLATLQLVVPLQAADSSFSSARNPSFSSARNSSVSGEAEQLNFRQSLQRALERSPDYDIQKKTKQISEWQYKNSWAILLPRVDVEAQHYYTSQGRGFLTTNESGALLNTAVSPWTDNLGFTVAENLYDNGDSIRLSEIANYNRQAAGIGLDRSMQQLLLSVTKAYYNYSFALLNLNLQSQEIAALRQQFETIKGRYQQGVNSNRDYLRIKAQLQRSEIDFAGQRIGVDEALQTLRQAMGEKGLTQFTPYIPDPLDLDQREIPEVNPENSFDFRIAHLQNKISDVKYRTVARTEWPRLTVMGAYNYNIPQYIGPTEGQSPYSDFQVGLSLDYSIFDWGTRHRQVEIAGSQRKIEQDQQESIRIGVLQDLEKLKSQNRFYFESYQKSKQVLKDQEDVYSSLSRGYREGKVTYLELITALSDLFAARTQHLSLQYSVLTSRAALAYYKGNLNEALGLH